MCVIFVVERMSASATLTASCTCTICASGWLASGWQCTFDFRPHEPRIARGDRIRFGDRARMWTGPLGDDMSELFRSHIGGMVCEILLIHRTTDYTQVNVRDPDTGLLVWVNVWHGYSQRGRGSGQSRNAGSRIWDSGSRIHRTQ